jgi:hypothetical protein
MRYAIDYVKGTLLLFFNIIQGFLNQQNEIGN